MKLRSVKKYFAFMYCVYTKLNFKNKNNGANDFKLFHHEVGC